MMEDILEVATMEMDEVIEKLQQGLSSVRTGRANALMLDGIFVEYYGSETPLNQISSVSVQEGRSLVVKPFDPSSLKDIERAIEKSDLDLPVQNDGSVCRINVPSLTEDTRKKLCKKVDKYAEEAKVSIRNARRDANDAVKKDKDLTEDLQKKAKEEIQKLTDKYVLEIEKVAKDKDAAIMTI
jgi:ribosome recycling factor